jgi:hypothetical protein
MDSTRTAESPVVAINDASSGGDIDGPIAYDF